MGLEISKNSEGVALFDSAEVQEIIRAYDRLRQYVTDFPTGRKEIEPLHVDIGLRLYESHVLVYTQTCEYIEERYGGLEAYWDYVCDRLHVREGCVLQMILHFDKKVPHIHLIIHAPYTLLNPNQVLTQLGETEYDDNGEIKFINRENYLSYSSHVDYVVEMFTKKSCHEEDTLKLDIAFNYIGINPYKYFLE